jgi:hypothetical protein
LAGAEVDDARAYDLVLPEVERVLTKTNEYEALWRSAWDKIATAIESFECGASNVIEFADAGLSLITLAPEVFSSSGFNPTRHAAPYTAITRYARGQLFLITTPLKYGWAYRIDYPYYSWAETVVRPRIPRRDFSQVLNELNERDSQGAGVWKLDQSEMTSAIKFLGSDGTLASSSLNPDEVATAIRMHSSSAQPAVAGH